MRSNFEYTGRDFVRVNLQVDTIAALIVLYFIVDSYGIYKYFDIQATLAISRIISGVSWNTDETLIKSSLNQISSLVTSDQGMKVSQRSW